MPDVGGVPLHALQAEHPEQARPADGFRLGSQGIHDGCHLCRLPTVGQVLVQVQDAASGFQS